VSYAPAPSRPIYNDDHSGAEVCEFDDTDLEPDWSYCPNCGTDIDRMSTNQSDYLCSCQNIRMTRTGGKLHQDTHECKLCGAIWVGLDSATVDVSECEPDRWNEEKARTAYAEYLKFTYGFELPVAA
jgi:hypothetical protein